MDMLSRVMNAVKDGYLMAADWVAAHPHMTIWGGLLLIALAASL
jgi:heme/copper-type cytochrome/quinol oxidase subunit 1